jgi:hypothetical protein
VAEGELLLVAEVVYRFDETFEVPFAVVEELLVVDSDLTEDSFEDEDDFLEVPELFVDDRVKVHEEVVV